MTDTYQPLKSSKSDLDRCDHEVFTFARQIGVAGAISLLVVRSSGGGGEGDFAARGVPRGGNGNGEGDFTARGASNAVGRRGHD